MLLERRRAVSCVWWSGPLGAETTIEGEHEERLFALAWPVRAVVQNEQLCGSIHLRRILTNRSNVGPTSLQKKRARATDVAVFHSSP